MKTFYCEECGIQMQKANMETHLAGKKHQKAVKMLSTQGRKLEVTGFTKTSISVVQDYFSQFGRVDSVVMDRDKAIVMFVESHSCDVALSCPIHIMNNERVEVYETKVKLKPRHVKQISAQVAPKPATATTHQGVSNMDMIRCDVCNISVTSEVRYKSHLYSHQHKDMESKSRTLYVTQFSSMSEDNLKQYFSQFGKIETARVFPQYNDATVTFLHKKDRDDTLAIKHHYHHGHPLVVAKPTTKNKKEWLQLLTKDKEKERNELSLICRKVVSCSTLKTQVDTLMSQIEMPPRVIDERQEFVTDLQLQLQRFIPEVKFEIYGSTATGLGTRFSDLDMSLDLDTSVNRFGVDILPSPLPDLGEFPGFKVDRGLVTLDSIINASNEQVLAFFITCLKACEVDRAIRKYRPIPGARVSVLKFYHEIIGNCDITFGARLSVQNTRLLQLLSSLDFRLSKLTTVIRFWARQVGVVNDDYNKSLSNYSLTLLVYFYLQNTTLPVLPTVQGLADIVSLDKNYESVQVQGWDCGICSDVRSIRRLLLPERNTQSFAELVKGFFDFYANTNLHSNVICVRSGKLVDVLSFKLQMEMDNRLKDFVLSDLMIQDPFELCHNLCGHVSEHAARGSISPEFIKAAVKINHCPGWTLKTFIPIGTFLSPPPKPTPYSAPVLVPLQFHKLPLAFRTYGNLKYIEEQWHQWIVDIAVKVLTILEMDVVIVDEYDPKEELFPGDEILKSKSHKQNEFEMDLTNHDEESDKEAAENISSDDSDVDRWKSRRRRSYTPSDYSDSTRNGSGSDSDVIVLSDDSDIEVVDTAAASIFDAPKSPVHQKTLSPAPSRKAPDRKKEPIDKLPEEQDTTQVSMFDAPGLELPIVRPPPRAQKREDSPHRTEEEPSKSLTSTKSESSSKKRKKTFLYSAARHKIKKWSSSEIKVPEYRHHGLKFNLEVCTKDETFLKCRTFSNAWEERRSFSELKRAEFDDSLSYHKALAAAVMAENLNQKTENDILQFVLRIHRYSYGHSTKIELVPEKHGISLPNKFVYKLKSVLHEIITTTLKS